jgi:hypothetical protein
LAPATAFFSFVAGLVLPVAFLVGDGAAGGAANTSFFSSTMTMAATGAAFFVDPGLRPRFFKIELTYTSSSLRVAGFRVAKSISISSGLESFRPGSRLK